MERNCLTQNYLIVLMSILLCITSIMIFYINETENSLIFGVLSAQNNFEARQVVRDTWKRLADNKSLPVFFLIGERFCDVPMLDRISPYSCHRLQKTSLLNLSKDLTTAVFLHEQPHKTCYAGFTFQVNDKIVVNKLNIAEIFVRKVKHVKVHLVDAASKETIASVTFMPDRESYSQSLLSKSIEPYLLPKSFEGMILMEATDITLAEDCSWMGWSNGNGAINFLQLISPNAPMPITFNSDSCSPVSMGFYLYDLDEFEQQIQTEPSRLSKWKQETDSLKSKLLQESLEHKDILFLDVVDVYRNLPQKLLLFFQWVQKHKNFRHLVKVDDDSLLDMNLIETGLAHADPEAPSLWAELRTNWAVRTTGKWREDCYSSLVYPPFPCGAGYSLSRAAVRYLATSSEILETGFQGEDVSVGIWLSGLKLRRIASKSRWSCEAGCKPGTASVAQMTPAEMVRAWASWSKCGKWCGCPESTQR